MNDQDPVDPQVRRRNAQLGLALGAFALVVMVMFVINFTRQGLPKDPKVWKQMQEQQRKQQP